MGIMCVQIPMSVNHTYVISFIFFKIIHEEGIIKQHYKGNSLQKLNLRE